MLGLRWDGAGTVRSEVLLAAQTKWNGRKSIESAAFGRKSIESATFGRKAIESATFGRKSLEPREKGD